MPNMTAADVVRLLGRAAFGATAADLDEWTGKPYADLVEKLLDVPLALQGKWLDEPQRELIQDSGLGYLGQPDVEARAWWLERMRTTPWPLLERLTLFWHGHFATATRFDTGPYLGNVMVQNQLLRRNALGNFRTMVEEITVDAAMLMWLNGNINRIPQPNENYAREFFELFTLGKRPQVYTEKDIREAARAFTGWIVEYTDGTASFDAGGHDKGRKNILGTRVEDLGDQEYKKVVEIALKEPVAPRFVAEKLVTNFAYLVTERNLLASRDRLVTAVAGTLRSSNWDIRAAVRTLLLSEDFRAAPARKSRQIVRQPVELVVSACRALNVPAGESSFDEVLARMGQIVFQPPNVGGWPRSVRWISPVSTLGRYDFGLALWKAYPATNPALPQPDDLAGWAKRLGLAGLSANTTRQIKAYLSGRKSAGAAEKQQGVLALLICSPDWVVM